MTLTSSFSIFMLAVTLLSAGCCQPLQAQQVGVWYDTELQLTPEGENNHVNLLYLSNSYRWGEHWALNGATMSIAKTRSESLLTDLQTFSNIEADNLPLTLALLACEWNINANHTLHLGLRNMNEDYFVSPVTSLFLNSSCGVYPTVACNLPIANYPLASMGVHYAYTSAACNVQASLYNGMGYTRFSGRNNLWRVAPNGDGVALLAQADWTQREGVQYFVGTALHTGNDAGVDPTCALWAYTERSLSPTLALIAGYSHAFGQSTECTDFVGAGLQYSRGKSTLGAYTDFARFRHDREWATELTYKHDISSILFLQSSVHIIHHDTWQPVGMVRLSVRI